MWNCLWGNALKRSPGIIRKSRVSYPGPGFLSSATWPLLPKKHYNGLNQTKPIIFVGSVYIMRPPMNLTVRVGHQARLPCHSEGSPNNITYQWFRNGVDIQRVGGGLMERAGVFGDGSFVITSVEKTDMAVYMCRPSNGLSPPPEASAFLNVTCE